MRWTTCAGLVAFGLVSMTTMDARADALGDALYSRFGSDKANYENAQGLLGKGVHFDLTAGLWYANLSNGLSGLGTFANANDSPTETALHSIGTGRGLVRELRFGIAVAGNEAYFDYLSDQLVQTASEEAEAQTSNPIAKRVIRQLVGELRPDLKSILGPEAQVWVKAEYGKLQGEIENARIFGSFDGKPYFGSLSEGWQTEYFGAELGVFPWGKERVMSPGDSVAFGFYGKYRHFSRPLALGFSADQGDAKFFLASGDVTAVDFGVRVELSSCATFCGLVEASMTPFTGFSHLDLARYGGASGALFGMGARLEGSLPIKLSDAIFFGPYLGFRMDFLEPIGYSMNLDLKDTTTQVEIWTPDYFFWGPTAGIMARL